MQRDMVFMFPALVLKDEFVAGLRRAESINKTLPDVGDGKRGRMNKVIGIETIIAEFIEHYFECFEIDRLRLTDRCTDRPLR